MISVLHLIGVSCCCIGMVGVADDTLSAESTTSRAADILPTVDFLICAAGVVLLLVHVVLWLKRGRRDPFGSAPVRDNKLFEDALVLCILAYLSASLALSGLFEVTGSEDDDVFTRIGVGIGAQTIGIIAALFIASSRVRGGVRAFVLGAGRFRARSVLGVSGLTTIYALGLCPIILWLTVRLVLWAAPTHEFSNHQTLEALRQPDVTIGATILFWIGAGLIAPIAEELFFRGLLQTVLFNYLRRRWLAIFITATAFGLIHLSNPHHVPALIAFGVLLGYGYERTGSLLTPMLIHALFNFKALLWSAVDVSGA